MKYFVTGATGFIGGHLIAKLLARGDQVTCLVRNPDKAVSLAKQGVTLVKGDVADRATMREAMRGVDGVFHIAALYKLGLEFKDQMAAVNVDGTRHTLEAAVEAGVPKIVYTSTMAVFGNTHDQVVDETYRVEMQSLASEYERTKWAAHYEVAVPLQQKGAPLVIVQPGTVTGPGDTSPFNMVYDFYLQRMPVMMGPRGRCHGGARGRHCRRAHPGHGQRAQRRVVHFGRAGNDVQTDDGNVAGPLRHSSAQAVAAGLDRGAQFPTRRRTGAGLQAENGVLV